MIKPAFSTVACPAWPLDVIAPKCKQWGFPSIELRTFGDSSTQFACDPALTSPEKVRRLFAAAGTRIASLATSIGFDEPIFPPVIGNAISDNDGTVRAAKRAIDLAIALECPLVRVFGFEIQHAEPRKAAVARIVSRLKKVVDHAHRTGVRVTIENGGSFPTSAELIELIDAVQSPLLGACYNVAVAHNAGEIPAAGVGLLGDRLLNLRIKDLKGGQPVPLGEGEVPWGPAVRAVTQTSADETIVFEWDAAWFPNLPSADTIMPASARLIMSEVLQGKLPAGAPSAANAAPQGNARSHAGAH